MPRADTTTRPSLKLTLIATGVTLALGLSSGVNSQTSQREPTLEREQRNPRSAEPARRQHASPDRGGRPGSTAIRARSLDQRPAGSLVVSNCDDAGPGSLRATLAGAVDGDVIDLSGLTCGTITLTTGGIATNADVTIFGPGRDQLTISADQASDVLAHYGESLVVEGITLANGRHAASGGCLFTNGNLILSRSRITGCSVGGDTAEAFGGGIAAFGETHVVESLIEGNAVDAFEDSSGGGLFSAQAISLVDSVVSGNTVTTTAKKTGMEGGYTDHGAFGGGIGADGNVTITGSQVIGNEAITDQGAARGGGIFSLGDTSIGSNSLIEDNHLRGVGSTAYGGGIHADGTVLVTGSRISGNSAHSQGQWSYGGGINAGDFFRSESAGAVVLVGSTVSGNRNSADCSCFIQGGGAHSFGSIRGDDSTISDNQTLVNVAYSGTAQGGGLAVYGQLGDSILSLANTTVSSNRAIGGNSGLGVGGGLASIVGSSHLENVTITLNTASHAAAGVQVNTSDDASHALISTIVSGNTAPAAHDIGTNPNYEQTVTVIGDHNLVTIASANVVLPADTLDADPVLLPLANNGGATRTHALAACSPAIDAGSNPGDRDWDQRDQPFLRVYGSAADIGAFEWQPGAGVIFVDGFEVPPCPS